MADFYSDDSAPSEAQTDTEKPEASDQSDANEESESSEQTALIDKSILNGRECKVGEIIPMKVTAIYEDELEMCPANEKSENNPKKSYMDQSTGDLDAMAKSPTE